jgi:hypothetical protein
MKTTISTAKYTDRYIDTCGRDITDTDKLRCVAAMEMFL